MAITLGTNIPSYNARTQLSTTTNTLTKVMERLSSGLKINRAGDDAAGLVISENMEALVRGSKQAQANIQNAKSYLTIAEDGMVSIGDHLQRVNDLLVNMANDTNDINSRTAAVQEIIERIEEVDRLAESTNFNGQAMLDARDPDAKIIVQMGPDETLSSILDISDALTDCHIEKLGASLPGYLDPNSKQLGDVIYYTRDIINDQGEIETKYYSENATTGVVTEMTKDDYNAVDKTNATSGFNPTNENCRKYMAKVQDAIGTLATCRGLIGAYENRMDSSYDSMTTRIESLEAAKSIYQDADIAEEATRLSTNQILQQVQVSVLAQANTMQQVALSLLG